MQHAKKKRERASFTLFRCNYSNGREQVLSPMKVWVQMHLWKVFSAFLCGAAPYATRFPLQTDTVCLTAAWPHVWKHPRPSWTCIWPSLDYKETFVFCSVALLIHSLWHSTTSETRAEPLTKRFFTQAAVVWQFGGFVPWWGRTAGVLNHNTTPPHPPHPNHCAVVLLEGFPTYTSWSSVFVAWHLWNSRSLLVYRFMFGESWRK